MHNFICSIMDKHIKTNNKQNIHTKFCKMPVFDTRKADFKRLPYHNCKYMFIYINLSIYIYTHTHIHIYI